MAFITIDTKGVKKFEGAVLNTRRDLIPQLKLTGKQVGSKLKANIQRFMPQLTGNLKRSVRFRTLNAQKSVVVITAPYALAQDQGVNPNSGAGFVNLPVTRPRFGSLSQGVMAKGRRHPGIKGKQFVRKGIEKTRKELEESNKRLQRVIERKLNV